MMATLSKCPVLNMIPTAFELYTRVGVEFFFSEQLLVLNSTSAKQDLLIIDNYFDYKNSDDELNFSISLLKSIGSLRIFSPP